MPLYYGGTEMSLLDKFELFNAKTGKSGIKRLTIGKSGFATFGVAVASELGLGKAYKTVSFFLNKTNSNVLGFRFFVNGSGQLKLTKRALNVCCCARALRKEFPEYIGTYKMVGMENHKDYTDCLFEKL